MSKIFVALMLLTAACSSSSSSSNDSELGDVATQGDFCQAAATVACDLAISCSANAEERDACIATESAACQQRLEGCTGYAEARAQDCLDAMMAATCSGLDAEWVGAAATCDFGC